MTLILELPRELEAKLSDEATRLGLPLEEYALHRLDQAPASIASEPKNGAELVAYWRREGVIGSRSDVRDSQSHARDIRRKAERRARG